MADLDDLRDGNDFGLDKPVEQGGFYLKGCDHAGWGVKDRMSRIFRPDTGKSVMLAFDHGFIMGPTSGVERIDLSILPLVPHADCLMGTRGVIKSCIPPTYNKPICLRSDAGTSILTELNHNVVMDVQNAVALNASVMAIMLAIGDPSTEAKTVANLYNLVDQAEKFGMPVMGVTAVGKDMVRDARYFGLASRICAENGASIVKTYYTEGFENVVACCPVPIVIAGGKKMPELAALDLCYKAIQCGAAGVDMGRNVFQSGDPVAMIQAVGGVVHDGLSPEEGFEKFNDLKNK